MTIRLDSKHRRRESGARLIRKSGRVKKIRVHLRMSRLIRKNIVTLKTRVRRRVDLPINTLDCFSATIDSHIQVGKTATKRPPTKAGANRPAHAPESKRTPKTSKKIVQPIAAPPQGETKGGKILALIGREQGASLTELREATGWQAHYADVRIMPTCAGNPASGAGIAAMESA